MLTNELENPLFISIVICTFNRKRLLSECIRSILESDYPKSLYEILVIDGGSRDGTIEIKRQFPNIRFIVEQRHGLAYARNKGAELAKGSIIVYTDDDCIVDKGWLRNLILGFDYSSKVGGVGGPVFPAFPQLIPKKILVKPALGLFDEGSEVKFVDGIITSNSAFKREIFRIAQFDESLGTTRKGKLILCGEDVDFCKTIVGLNYKLLYVPSARVYHQVRKDRVNVAYIIKHASHHGLSWANFFKKTKNSRLWMIRFAMVQLIKNVSLVASDRSFTVCYKIIASFSALFVCVTGLERILS